MTQLLLFSANWCQPCKMIKAMLVADDTGLEFEVVDVDIDMDRARRYGVTNVPTIIFLDNDTKEPYDRIVGTTTIKKIKEKIKGGTQ